MRLEIEKICRLLSMYVQFKYVCVLELRCRGIAIGSPTVTAALSMNIMRSKFYEFNIGLEP